MTASPNVTLTLSGTGATQMWLSNDQSFPTSTAPSTGWIPFQTPYPWTLSPGTGEKTVYARFSANGSSTIGAAQASIQLLGGGATTTSEGQVLGASLSCGLYLNDYIHPSRKSLNDPNEVKKLQTFLDIYMNANLPVTGDYDPATIAAVDRFQVRNNASVLAPWVPYGLQNDMTPTGYVYKTTRRWINLIVCPPLGIPMPQLP
jgi:hypothetical protein